jgi:hypothetical protein
VVTLGVGSAWFLFVWQPPSGPGGAILDVAVRYYRPFLWATLSFAAVVLFIVALVWIRGRSPFSRP